MKNISQVAFLVQARLSSQRCPRKMIRPFAETTLLDINIQKLVESEFIPNENIYVSIHEPELKEIARKYPVNIFDRSEKSANSEGTPMTEIYEWWDKLPHSHVVLTNACAPMLKTETIENFTKAFLNTDSDGMFGVMAKKNYFWDSTGKFLTPLEGAVMNTKFAKPIYEAAHVLYASKLEDIGRGIWMGDFSVPGQIELFEVEEQECFDIDYEWEFEIYEKLYRNK